MSRFSKKCWATCAALAIVAMVSQVALAQREEGRRGRGGPGGFGGPPSATSLLRIEAVQTALNLTDDQKEKITKINDEIRGEARKLYDEGGDREKLQELYSGASAKINEVLDEGQQKRLMGILIQASGANAILDSAVSKELNITDDQKKKLDEARDENRKSMQEAFEASRGQDQNASGEERRARFDKLREEANGRLMAVLTDEQKEKLESLKGEKVDIDMSQLRGGRGFGGRGGRGEGGERGRGERNRDEPSSESKSSS